LVLSSILNLKTHKLLILVAINGSKKSILTVLEGSQDLPIQHKKEKTNKQTQEYT
jgi:hypothetical protein